MCPQRAGGRPQQDGEDACPHREQWVRERGMGLEWNPAFLEGKPHRMELGTRNRPEVTPCAGWACPELRERSQHLGERGAASGTAGTGVQPQPQREEGPVCSWGRQRRRLREAESPSRGLP